MTPCTLWSTLFWSTLTSRWSQSGSHWVSEIAVVSERLFVCVCVRERERKRERGRERDRIRKHYKNQNVYNTWRVRSKCSYRNKSNYV